jgi:hypothetical protein
MRVRTWKKGALTTSSSLSCFVVEDAGAPFLGSSHSLRPTCKQASRVTRYDQVPKSRTYLNMITDGACFCCRAFVAENVNLYIPESSRQTRIRGQELPPTFSM